LDCFGDDEVDVFPKQFRSKNETSVQQGSMDATRTARERQLDFEMSDWFVQYKYTRSQSSNVVNRGTSSRHSRMSSLLITREYCFVVEPVRLNVPHSTSTFC
jgi:hypothetical protein